MTDVNFNDPNAIERATAEARKALGSGNQQSQGGIDPSTGLPYDPNYSVVNVDISQFLIPGSNPPRYDIGAYLSKVFGQDTFLNLGLNDPGNPNTYIAIIGALQQISSVWGSLSASDKDLVNKFLGGIPTNPVDGNQSLIQVAVRALIGTFWQGTKGTIAEREAQTKQFISNLLGKFGGGTSNSWIGSAVATLQDYQNGMLDQFIERYGSMSQNDFNFTIKLQGEAVILAEGMVSKYEDQFNHMEIEEAVKNCHDPFELMVALLAILYQQNDTMQLEQSGLGNTLNNILPGLMNKATDLLQKWQGNVGTFTAAGVKAFMDSLKDLQLAFQDKLISSGADGVNQAYNAFFSTDSKDGITLNPPTRLPNGQEATTVGQVVQYAYAHNDFNLLAQTLNSPQFAPSVGNNNIPPNYTRGISLFSGCQSACQSVSSTTTQALQTQQGISDKFLQLLGATIAVCWDAVKVMTQNQQAT